MVIFTLWNFLWIFSILSLCESSPLPYEAIYESSAFYLNVYGHLYLIKIFMKLWCFILIYMVTFTLWNFMWIFYILSSCICSPLPDETLYELFAFYLYLYVHLYLVKLYMNLPYFIFMSMVTITIWNIIWTFRILSSHICPPVPYVSLYETLAFIGSPLLRETLYEPSAFYLHVYSHGYHMKLHMNLLHFIFMYMMTFTCESLY